ncbi:zinc finger protein [Oryctes borbonicus]|uniref:Zinc finger protein n=1 Tax=Oryctes borbonicus TaxID=1629725 RepID=A0A0T6AXP8_9SCAR|nr:zinc finger protein [Oryctes borbonicus]
MLQIVFLTPANIQGQKKYVCTRCSTMYESPNPLKLHVTLACGTHSISWLWSKLSNLICGSSNRDYSVKEFTFKLLPDLQVTKQRSAIDLSIGTHNLSQNTSNKLYRLLLTETHSSAFKPFQRSTSKDDGHSSVERRCIYPSWPHFSLTKESASPPIKLEHRYQNEAQIETLVSSLGKSKHGHICLYCGKRYSRKYGLKIHIRTHTGYKPLKCKYCLRPFGDPSNLNKHVRLHAAGDTPYKCDLCGKVLVRRRDLERHLKSRHTADMHPEGSSLNIKQEVLDTNDEEKHICVN